MIVNIEKSEMLILCDALDLYITNHKGLSRGRVVGILKEKMDIFKKDIHEGKNGWNREEEEKIIEFIATISNPKRRRTK